MLTAYRAALPGVALLCSIVAFILAMCCLLAGTNPSTLTNMQLYTLNTSGIGATIQQNLGLPPPDPSFNFSTMLPRDISDDISKAGDAIESKGKDVAGDAADAIKDPAAAIKDLKANITETIDKGKEELKAAGEKVKSAAKNATAKIVSTFVNETIATLNVDDFYLAHLLTYCEGRYTSPKDGRKENITYCSNHKPNHKFNATNSTSKDNDDPFAFIENLHLPDPVGLAMKAITLLSKIIAAIYILGIIAIFFALVAYTFLVPAIAKGKLLRWAGLAMSLGAFIALLLGTILVHFMCSKLCGFFEEHESLGVQAKVGNNWMQCSIAATVFMGIAVTFSLLDVCVDHAVSSGKDKVAGLGKGIFGLGRKKRQGKEYEMEEN